MEFTTQVQIASDGLQLTHRQHMLLMGSCFAEEVGRLLSADCFRALVNPFGVLYNPLSIAQAIEFMLEETPDYSLFQHQGMWHSWLFHSRYSSPEVLRAQEMMKASVQSGQKQLDELDVLMLTWGTNRYYKFKDKVVANCHKLPEQEFTQHAATVEEVVTHTEQMLGQLWKRRPSLQVVLTVSPIRYLKYGLHGNQLSKAVLLLAAEVLCQRYPGTIHYFPAYEIVTDELRDYRYYAEDMVHPTPLAVHYVYERLSQSWVSSEEQRLSAECRKIHQARHHKPLHPDSDEYKKFLLQLKTKVENLKKSHPYLDLDFDLD